MPRIFSLDFRVPEDAIDELGHVNNLKYLGWMQDVALSHSAAQGWPIERYVDLGQVWVVQSHFIKYVRPAFEGDHISLLTWVSGFSPRNSPRKYLFWRASDQQVLAEAETIWVFVDLKSGRRCRLPDSVRNAFEIVDDPDEAKEQAKSASPS
jgi:acyl-CoA thioester hydrolase